MLRVSVHGVRWWLLLPNCCSCRLFATSRQGSELGPDYYTAEDYFQDSMTVETDNFKDLGVTSLLRRRLAREGIVTPTAIQSMALPETFLRECQVMVQAETGTGKTLTYLLPALQDVRPGLTSLILTPSRELATQVFYWSKKLAGNRKDSRRVAVVYSGQKEQDSVKLVEETKPNILIGTPKCLLQMFLEKGTLFRSVRRIVLDEGDKILQPLGEHSPWRKRRVRDIHPRPGRLLVEGVLKGKQKVGLICTSATIYKALRAELAEIGWGDNAKFITTVQHASLPATIEHQFIRCTSEEEEEEEEKDVSGKTTALVQHFKTFGLTSALVFIGGSSPMDSFVSQLTYRGLKSVALYKSLTPEVYDKFLEEAKQGEINVLVGTEQTVRGLDFCFIDTVFLMEVPRNAQEYIHLAGRVGRMGQKGKVVVMIGEEDPRDMTRLRRIHSQLGVEGTELYHKPRHETDY